MIWIVSVLHSQIGQLGLDQSLTDSQDSQDRSPGDQIQTLVATRCVHQKLGNLRLHAASMMELQDSILVQGPQKHTTKNLGFMKFMNLLCDTSATCSMDIHDLNHLHGDSQEMFTLLHGSAFKLFS